MKSRLPVTCNILGAMTVPNKWQSERDIVNVFSLCAGGFGLVCHNHFSVYVVTNPCRILLV